MKTRLIALLAGAALAVGGVFAVAPASAAPLPVGSSKIIIVKAFPTKIQNTRPTSIATNTGLAHNGVKTLVSVPKSKCFSGKALQGIYYSWGFYAHMWIKGPALYLGVCR